MEEEQDAVARIVEQWSVERPELDASPMLVIGRLHRVSLLLDAELRPVFAAAGLGDGDFDVLATLRRAGEPFVLTPSQLRATMMVTSGAVTKRIDRLVEQGLVAREESDGDGRVRPVRLTAKGRAIVDATVGQHVANEARLLEAFTAEERQTLADLLRRWLLELGD